MCILPMLSKINCILRKLSNINHLLQNRGFGLLETASKKNIRNGIYHSVT